MERRLIGESDKVPTVNPYYALEIISGSAKGVKWMTYYGRLVIGIVNGMDVTEWDPKTDKYLPLNYDQTDAMDEKPIIKETLQAQVGLPVDRIIPLFGFVGRLEEQKGSDILVDATPDFIGENVQIVVLGTGNKNMENQLSQLELKYPDNATGIARFDVPLAHLIVSGADFFMLIPGRFEPCGLIQLHATNNGTCDVVDPGDVAAVAKTVKKAIGIYGTPAYSEMVRNCMSRDLSWKVPAKKWEEILSSLRAYCNKSRSAGEEEFPLVRKCDFPLTTSLFVQIVIKAPISLRSCNTSHKNKILSKLVLGCTSRLSNHNVTPTFERIYFQLLFSCFHFTQSSSIWWHINV